MQGGMLVGGNIRGQDIGGDTQGGNMQGGNRVHMDKVISLRTDDQYGEATIQIVTTEHKIWIRAESKEEVILLCIKLWAISRNVKTNFPLLTTLSPPSLPQMRRWLFSTVFNTNVSPPFPYYPPPFPLIVPLYL